MLITKKTIIKDLILNNSLISILIRKWDTKLLNKRKEEIFLIILKITLFRRIVAFPKLPCQRQNATGRNINIFLV